MFPAETLRGHIQRHRFDPVFRTLAEWAGQEALLGLATAVSLLQSRYAKLQRDARLGLLAYDEESRNTNRLTLDLLDLIARLEAGATDFGPPSELGSSPAPTHIYHITQNHYGEGDNVAGDKKTNKPKN